MQKRGDKEKPSQREGTHFKMCVINVRSLVSSIYSRCWSRPPCPNLIGSINLNQLVIQRQGEREAKAQAAKRQAESTQEADARRKRVAKAQAAKRQAESTLEADTRRKKGDYIHTTCLCILASYPSLGTRLRGPATHPNYL